MAIKEDPIKRFVRKFTIPSIGDCWIWLGAVCVSGYGQVRYDSKTEKAHRVSYRLFRGPVLDQMKICHRCDNPSCVNPIHLFIGTQKDNMQDAAKKNRLSRSRKPYVSFPKSNETHPRAKFTNEQVRAIRKNHACAIDLAKAFNVHPRTIRDIKFLRSYKDVL